jgi:hypothetical protein
MRRLVGATLATIALVQLLAPTARAEALRLETNQSYIEEVTRQTNVPLHDLKAMFAFVLRSLPDRVNVYPTESYYYYTFYHRGVRYAGNIRLDAKDRDEGTVHFAVFEDYQEWTEGKPIQYRTFNRSDGVVVRKTERLVYRVSLEEKTVEFRLNDLAHVVPPKHAVAPGEQYLGPVFDESGVRLFLLFNPRLKIFHFVLDETVSLSEPFQIALSTDRILIGTRTGFAYYRDLRRDRKILIGVYEGNSRVNNQFDGPFDQLPDSFIKGEELRSAILAIDPSLKGKIDRFGGSPDGSGRFLIAPYLHYSEQEQLSVFHQCATDKRVPIVSYYQCFVLDYSGYESGDILPMALKKLAPLNTQGPK